MSTVINKNTFQVIKSANTPKYSPDEWFINPLVPECDPKYWIIRDGKLSEMTANEKSGVDAALEDSIKGIEKESLIYAKQTELARAEAIAALKVDGVLDSKGEIIGG